MSQGKKEKSENGLASEVSKLKDSKHRSRSLSRGRTSANQKITDMLSQPKKRRKVGSGKDDEDEEDDFQGDIPSDLGVQILQAIQSMTQIIQVSQTKTVELLSQHLTSTEGKIKKLEESTEHNSVSIAELKSENEDLKNRLVISEGRVERLERTVQQMKDDILQMSSRMMRNNLVFQNIPEKQNERPEETLAELQKFLAKEMKVTEAKSLSIDRVHRVGQRDSNRARPVVAHFVRSDDKVKVLKNGKNLKDLPGNYWVNEQFPQEVEEKRRGLRTVIKQTKQQDSNAKCYLNVDKLYINNQLYRQESESSKYTFSDDDVKRAKDIDVHGTEPTTDRGSVFQGFAAKIRSPDDVKPAILKMFTVNKLTASATHIVYSYRVKYQGRMRENFADDGEFGEGRRITNLLQGRGLEGILVMVPRWYGGTHLGVDRHNLYKDCANTAINLLGF